MQPPSDDTGDVKEWITSVLIRMAEIGQSVALDLGGGDRVLAEYGRDLALVEFCQETGAQPLALCFMGPDAADLEHVLTIVRAGYFRPDRMILVLNENLVPSHKSPAAAFEPIVECGEFVELVSAGAQPVYLPALPCMDRIRQGGLGSTAAARVSTRYAPSWSVAGWHVSRTRWGRQARQSGCLERSRPPAECRSDRSGASCGPAAG